MVAEVDELQADLERYMDLLRDGVASEILLAREGRVVARLLPVVGTAEDEG